MVRFVVIYIHHEGYIETMKIMVAKNLGRDGEIIVSWKMLRNMGMIPERWPQIYTTKFAEWDDDTFDKLDMEFEEKVNNLIKEGADQQDMD